MIAQFDDYDIQPIHSGDAWKLCDFIVSNSERLKRFFPKTLEDNLTPTLSQVFVEKKVKQFTNREEFLFTVKHSKTRELVSLIYIKELDWNIKQGEFAYCIGYNFEGKGIITKAVNILSQYAFDTHDIKTLQIIVYKENVRSANVAKACNFTWVKTLENEFVPPGEAPLDMELYERYKR